MSVKNKLAEILPQIRDGQVEEDDLPDILDEYLLDTGYPQMEIEYQQHAQSVSTLDGLVGKLSDIKSIASADLAKEVLGAGE